jgi:hypothetical protein
MAQQEHTQELRALSRQIVPSQTLNWYRKTQNKLSHENKLPIAGNG